MLLLSKVQVRIHWSRNIFEEVDGYGFLASFSILYFWGLICFLCFLDTEILFFLNFEIFLTSQLLGCHSLGEAEEQEPFQDIGVC